MPLDLDRADTPRPSAILMVPGTKVLSIVRLAIASAPPRSALATAGQRAGDLESALVYGEPLANGAFADGVTLFHAAHGNLGTPSVIA
jgi:hypothetical protein